MDVDDIISTSIGQKTTNIEVEESEEEHYPNDDFSNNVSVFPTPTNPFTSQEFINPNIDKKLILIRELKMLLSKNPNARIDGKMTELGMRLNSCSYEELTIMKENLLLDLGLIQPHENATNIIKYAGFMLEKAFGLKGFEERLSSDIQLISAVDRFVPNFFERLSEPLKIAYRIGHNLNQHLFKDESVSAIRDPSQSPPRKRRRRSGSVGKDSDAVECVSGGENRIREDNSSDEVIQTTIQGER